jgi:hypothetical protein
MVAGQVGAAQISMGQICAEQIDFLFGRKRLGVGEGSALSLRERETLPDGRDCLQARGTKRAVHDSLAGSEKIETFNKVMGVLKGESK